MMKKRILLMKRLMKAFSHEELQRLLVILILDEQVKLRLAKELVDLAGEETVENILNGKENNNKIDWSAITKRVLMESGRPKTITFLMINRNMSLEEAQDYIEKIENEKRKNT
jgi:hypothetical protein